ncbi:MAG: hypothetical protein WD801_09390 [Gemmatimonadaceae bacterium]
MRRQSLVLFATLLTLSVGASAGAQDTDALGIRAARRDTIAASATVTAAFTVVNRRDEAVQVMPHVELPETWTMLTGGALLPVPPRSTEMLMLSIVVPSRAAAGVYPVRLTVTTTANPEGVMDSILVLVQPRRAVEITLLDRPGFVVSGKGYEATFLVRNRGNVAGRMRLTARGSLGAVTLSDTAFALQSQESRVVRVTSHTPAGLQGAQDDVLEVAAFQEGDEHAANASARTTVVPEPSRKIEEFLRIPTRVHLRAATSDGVSPFELFGQGKLVDGGTVTLDFLMRGPTGHYAAFGERDEYRVELSAPSWRARGGDQLFMLSSLTGSGQPGFGLGADGTRGMFSFGGYGQQFRRVPERGAEGGLFLTAQPRLDTRFTVNLVDRIGGALPGAIASGIASFDRDILSASAELARSRSASGGGGGPGLAHTMRVSVGAQSFSLDVGHRSADTTFAGAQRAADHLYVTSYVRARDGLAFNVNGSRQEADLSRTTGVPYVERFDLGSISTTIMDQVTLELGTVSRGTTVQGISRSGVQNSLRARSDLRVPFGTLQLEIERGRSRFSDAASRTFTEASVGIRSAVRAGSFGAYVERYSGGGVTKGLDGAITGGGDVSVRLNRSTHLSLMGYGTRVQSSGAGWHSQLDGLISHTRANGSSISLRTRLMRGGTLDAGDQNVAYLEFGIPLQLPVSRLRTPGRVYGRVVDAVSGQGVPNALVRLGPQVAITDRQGQVAFGGVPGGEHRLSMSQETSFANAVFVGDPTLMVDSLRHTPTTFAMAIARSARIDIDVRQFIVARTGVAGAPDSLADAGALSNATLMLTGARDTLYRTTNASGKVSFADVPPGDWLLSIRGDAPAHHRFDPDRVELTLEPGETRTLSFRLMPRRREVQIIGEDEELRSIQAAPKTQAPAAGTKTIKPNAGIQQ